MDFREAWSIMERNALVSRRASKKFLDMVTTGKPALSGGFSEVISVEAFDELRRKFQEKKDALEADNVDIIPRNLPFYLMIRDMYPDFEWTISKEQGENDHLHVEFAWPLVEGLRPTLTSMLLNIVNADTGTELHRSYRAVYDLPSEFVSRLSTFMATTGLAKPSQNEMWRFVNWLKLGMTGAPLTVITPICPDYAAVEVGRGLYRYTFDSLGSDIGVSGRRLFDAVTNVHVLFQDLGLTFRHIVAVGDFEAFSPANCERVGLTEAEFIGHLEGSVKALAEASPVPIDAMLYTGICGGKKGWQELFSPILAKFRERDFGHTGLNETDIRHIAAARKPLYRRWYGEMTDDQAIDLVLAQGAEYGTMGGAAGMNLDNPLIFGSDHAKMSPFYSFSQPIPVLYLTSNYMGVNS